jgi:tetratricopeptide (TPR) repeat protein
MPPPAPAAQSSNAALFGGLLVVALLLIAGGWYYWSSAPASRSASTSPPAASDPNQIASVAQIITRDLVDGKALIEKREYEVAIRDHFDRILLLDPKHSEAIALKAKAEEALAQQKLEVANSAAPSAPARGAATASPATPTTPSTSAPPARGAAAAAAARGGARGVQALPSPRRPNETEQAWRTRNAALQTQYDGAKTAFDRRQFAAAISGFEAVLKAEPKYRDAPQLLARARVEIKTTGRDALEAGNRFDAGGRWTQALEQYDRARQLDPSLRTQADDARTRVLAKMRGAGGDAFKRARQFDALGRSAEALKEYENAAQWLPPDDANRAVARQRADQLKAGVK